jgi:hypothetical protein
MRLATDLTVHTPRVKGFSAWLACAWLALPSLAQADGPAPNAEALGVAESTLNYCGPLEPAAADRLRQMIKSLVQGASEQQLAEVRKSDEYRKAYASVVDFVARGDRRSARRFCSESPIDRKWGTDGRRLQYGTSE